METLFYILAFLQIVVGLYLILQSIQWSSYVRRRLQTDAGFYTPKTAVLCPCRGMELDLEKNLKALCEFDYQNYELFFILASATDAAYSIVKRVAEQAGAKAHIVIANKPQGRSEKVNNLSVAISQLDAEFEALVFADSDGRPGKGWLRKLIAPLSDSRIGATTTMRWFMPNKIDFSTALLAAWNAPVLTMLTENGPNFCWGGGTAIRRALFEQIGVMTDWENSVSDDCSLTLALRRAGRSILFLPECLTVSHVSADFGSVLEFTNRQILITRVYLPKMWLAAFGAHFLYCFTLLLGIVVTMQEMIATRPALHLATLVFVPLLLSAIRSAIRLAGVTEALPAWRQQIMGLAWIYIALPIFAPFLYLINFLNSIVTRKIRWRGAIYELVSSGQTRIISY
jgi:cellulose synthase/poly-beta-1,6-N-acetylglucosamine synthase-like glycosyltransferase